MDTCMNLGKKSTLVRLHINQVINTEYGEPRRTQLLLKKRSLVETINPHPKGKGHFETNLMYTHKANTQEATLNLHVNVEKAYVHTQA